MSQKLFAVGLLIFLAGMGMYVSATLGQGSASIGGVVFIGPFPIVFGSGPGGWELALGSVLIGAAMLILLLAWGMRLGDKKDG